MRLIRSHGNASTERVVARSLGASGIRGWRRQISVHGVSVDFYFRATRTVIQVHGCFWHDCGVCMRTARLRSATWREKLSGNAARDRKQIRLLRKHDIAVVVVWEHELRDGRWLVRVRRTLARRQRASAAPTVGHQERFPLRGVSRSSVDNNARYAPP
ncbi:MAG: hypothetical protein HY275_01850 [Gemmatimonadetes bacterium]|nr:hypothetical protein [Gemmatimonadota bacterium]